ncbi:MAG: hypothetical protein KGS61_09875 [Verrucomicrobia bacterium]|nr:hypothetical protein [Verrucomicrobiota bacterium]
MRALPPPPRSPIPTPAGGVAETLRLLRVAYRRLKSAEGDLYLTRYGAPFWQHLAPENWFAPDWFAARRTQLQGTSTIYKLPTKPVAGVSIDLVVRFSRIGQDVPLDTQSFERNLDVEFNSPFEEFALVMELRALRPRIYTKRPLAIFVPAKRLQLWQTGRAESKIAAKLARHPEVQLDILRQYILLYGWIEGLNVMQVLERGTTRVPLSDEFSRAITRRAIGDLARHGFRMADIKPEHLLLRVRPDGSLLHLRDGRVAYALVDYELLERS